MHQGLLIQRHCLPLWILLSNWLVSKFNYRRREKISYWHTYYDQEVDAIIGDAKVAIEIKSSEEVKTRHKNGLKAFKEEHPDCRPILVSLDYITRPSGALDTDDMRLPINLAV